jgi:hypothetical protein
MWKEAPYERRKDTVGCGDGKNKLEEGYGKRFYWRDICMEGEQWERDMTGEEKG